MNQTASSAIVGAFLILYILLSIGIYIAFSYPMMKIAERLGDSSPWQAWVPLLNVFQILRLAEKPWYYFLLLLIPLVGIVIAVMAWMRISERCNKPSWYGIISLVPLAGVFLPWVLLS